MEPTHAAALLLNPELSIGGGVSAPVINIRSIMLSSFPVRFNENFLINDLETLAGLPLCLQPHKELTKGKITSTTKRNKDCVILI
jgi:hypothetical protein